MRLQRRDKHAVPRVPAGIFAASLASGVGAALYFQDWVAIGLIGVVTFAALTAIYTIVALLFNWPKLRWREFFADLVGFLTFS
jgi:hypothetical protein